MTMRDTKPGTGTRWSHLLHSVASISQAPRTVDQGLLKQIISPIFSLWSLGKGGSVKVKGRV